MINVCINPNILLQRDESGGVSSSNSWPSVLHRLVRDGEFAQVVAHHLWLDLNLGENLAVVYTNNRSSHLRDNDHISQMSLHNIWLLVDRGFLLLLPEFLDQGHWLTLKTTRELAPDSAGEELHQALIVHVQELIEVNTTVGELAESPLLLQLSSVIGHGDQRLSLVEVNQAILSL